MKKQVIAATTLALLLCGCGKAPPDTGPKIPPIQRDLETCAITSDGMMAETDGGYYLTMEGKLYYADKSDLGNWVQVCNEPDCGHAGNPSCPADVNYGFWIRNNRIYTLRSTTGINRNATAKLGIYSMAPDGTDLRLEYPVDMIPADRGGAYSFQWREDALYLSTSMMEKDGSWECLLGRLDRDGIHIFNEKTAADMENTLLFCPFQGEEAVFYSDHLSGGGEAWNRHIYRERDGKFEEIPGVCQYPPYGSYLRGDTLFYYAPNDGYYQVELTTGNAEKRMDSRMPDGHATHFSENFLVEYTIGNESSQETPRMELYDGSRWRPVALPEGIWPGEDCYFSLLALTTEDLFLTVLDQTQKDSTTTLYRIDLTGEVLKAERCSEFRFESYTRPNS